MDAAREYTDREIRRVARDLAMEYGREGELAASKVLDFLTERAVDGVVPESALQGRDWARLRSEVARQMSDRNRESVTGMYGDLTKVRDLTAGDAEPRSRMPEPSLNRARDLAWNERHVEAAARASVGKDPSVAAKGVRGLADMNRNAAVRKARTAINGAENAGRMDAMLARGGSKRWVAVMDERTRVSHASINGEVRPVSKPFSNGLMYPGDPSGPPEEVYNCRCTIEWVAGRDGDIDQDELQEAFDVWSWSGATMRQAQIGELPDNEISRKLAEQADLIDKYVLETGMGDDAGWIYRGMYDMSPEDVAKFTEVGSDIGFGGTTSWSQDLNMAKQFGQASNPNSVSVVFRGYFEDGAANISEWLSLDEAEFAVSKTTRATIESARFNKVDNTWYVTVYERTKKRHAR